MKSKLWIIPALVLCLVACLAFTACGDNGSGDDQGPTAELDVKYVAEANGVAAHYEVIGIVEGDDNEKLVIPDTMKYVYEEEEPVLDDAGNKTYDDAGDPITQMVKKEKDVPVTVIVSRAFYNNSVIKSVVIGNNVTSIGDRAFDSCDSITAVTIGTGITAIPERAFLSCTSLASVSLHKGIKKIGVSAFEDCKALTSVTFEDNGLASIGERAFYGCSSIKDIKIPESVNNIDVDAFALCTGIIERATKIEFNATVYADSVSYVDSWIVAWDKEFNGSNNVVIRDGTVGIAALAFASDALHPIDSITFPATMHSAADNAFEGCQIVEAIAPASVFNVVPLETLKHATVDGGNQIIEGTFAYAPMLEGVVIRGNISKIGKNAFVGCEKLSEIEIAQGTSIKEILDSAFKDCASITSFDVTAGCTKIERSAFQGCSSLTSINLRSVKSIGEAAFAYCDSLESLVLPESATALGASLFYNCNSLASVTLPTGITEIPSNFFHGCGALASVAIPEGVVRIGEYAFSECDSLTEITLPAAVTEIADAVFAGCNSLATVNVPAGVTSIGNYAFYKCIALSGVEISAVCEKIGTSAFEGCSAITSIVIPESVTKIGSYAFFECEALKDVTLPTTVTSVGKRAFDGCVAINYTVEGGCYYIGSGDNAYNMLVKVDEQAFTGINAATRIIGSGVFEGTGISSVTIPASVIEIGEGAFRYCASLTEIVLPEGLVSIGNGAFMGCSLITRIEIPASLKQISNYAFSGCESLTEIVLNGEISIGRYAFEKCTGISELVLLNTVKHIDDYAFSGCDSLWSIEIKAVDSIGLYAFFGAQIKKATLPAEAFSGIDMNYLESAVITEGKLGAGVFRGCVTLKNVEILDGVTEVASTAFSGCDGVLEVIDNVVYVDNWVVDFKGKVDMNKINTSEYVNVVIREGTVGISSTAFAMTSASSVYYAAAIRHITIPETVKYYSDTSFNGAFIKGATVAAYMLGYVIAGEEGERDIIVDAAFDVSALEYLTITSGEIIEGAVEDVKKLISVTIGEGVTAIGEDAFSGCDKLIEVRNLSSLEITKGADTHGLVAKNAKNVYGADGTSALTVTEDKLVYIKDGAKTYLVAYIGDGNDLVLPAKLDGADYDIYRYAFYEYQNIQTVKIEAGSNISIGEYAFAESVNISTVTLGSGVREIGKNAFAGSKGLTFVYVPKTVTKIGQGAFPGTSIARSLRICFEGTADEYANINGGAAFKKMTYFFSEAKPTAEGQYWHYDSKGAIALWPQVKK